MQHIKIIKDIRGTIEIRVKLWITNDSWDMKDKEGNLFRWDTVVLHTPKGKKKKVSKPDIAQAHEIWAAKREFWELIKP